MIKPLFVWILCISNTTEPEIVGEVKKKQTIITEYTQTIYLEEDDEIDYDEFDELLEKEDLPKPQTKITNIQEPKRGK